MFGLGVDFVCGVFIGPHGLNILNQKILVIDSTIRSTTWHIHIILLLLYLDIHNGIYKMPLPGAM